MPALNLSFTEEELEQIRHAAGQQAMSLKAFAHDAVIEAAQGRMIIEVAASVAKRSRELNRRLAQ